MSRTTVSLVITPAVIVSSSPCVPELSLLFVPFLVVLFYHLLLYFHTMRVPWSLLKTINEAHQGVMTDRRHFLKRGDRPTKKERQTTASGLEKSDKLRFVLWVKSDSDIYYNKTSDKAATKLVTSDLGYTLGGPHKCNVSRSSVWLLAYIHIKVRLRAAFVGYDSYSGVWKLVLTPQFLFVKFMAKFEIQPPYPCLLDSIRQNTNCSRKIAACNPLEINVIGRFPFNGLTGQTRILFSVSMERHGLCFSNI